MASEKFRNVKVCTDKYTVVESLSKESCDFMISNTPVVNQIKTKDNPVLSWCVPNEDGTTFQNLCFYVREVQEFIQKSLDDPKNTEKKVPMFAREKIQKQLGSEHKIPEFMSDDFKVVFLDFDYLPISFRVVKVDFVFHQVLVRLQQYLSKMYTDNKNQIDQIPGFFWRSTVRTLAFLAYTGSSIAGWLVKNPFWMRTALYAAHAIRIGMCAIITFGVGASDILASFVTKFGYARFGHNFLILHTAAIMVGCFFSGGTVCAALITAGIEQATQNLLLSKLNGPLYYLSQYVKNSYDQIGQFLGNYGNWIFGYFDTRSLMNAYNDAMDPTKQEDLSNAVGFSYNASIIDTIKREYAHWPVEDVNLQIVIFMAKMISGLYQLGRRVLLAKGIIAPKKPGRSNWFRERANDLVHIINKNIDPYLEEYDDWGLILVLLQTGLKSTDYYRMVKNFLYEMYEWYTDLAPCLFYCAKYHFYKMLSINIEPPSISGCCLTPLITKMKTSVALTKEGVDLNNARIALNKKREDWTHMNSAGNLVRGALTEFGVKQLKTEQQHLRDRQRAFDDDVKYHRAYIATPLSGIATTAKDNEALIAIEAIATAIYAQKNPEKVKAALQTGVNIITGTAGAAGIAGHRSKQAAVAVSSAVLGGLSFLSMFANPTMQETECSNVVVFPCLSLTEIDEHSAFGKFGIKQVEDGLHMYCIFETDEFEWCFCLEEIRSKYPEVLWNFKQVWYALLNMLPEHIIVRLIQLETTPSVLLKCPTV